MSTQKLFRFGTDQFPFELESMEYGHAKRWYFFIGRILIISFTKQQNGIMLWVLFGGIGILDTTKPLPGESAGVDVYYIKLFRYRIDFLIRAKK